MNISPNALKLLLEWEGCKLKQYKDSGGLLTIGVGHLIKKGENFSKGITTSQALDLLADDIKQFEQSINSLVKVPLTQNQFDALVIFCFNIGVGAFTKSTLLRKLNSRLYKEVPYQLSLWTRADGKKVQGLINRRNKEIDLWNKED